METFDVDTFLKTRVGPHLEAMQRLRVRALTLYAVSGVFGLGAVGAFALLGERAAVPAITSLAIAVGTALFAGLAASERRTTFKQVVMRQLLGAVYPSLEYDPDSCISESLYRQSGLFRTSYDRYQGDDLVTGRVGETDLCFSELHTQYKTVTRDSKGRTTTHWHTIFQGIFFIADFHKHFASTTFVLPDSAQALLGDWLGQGLQALGSSHGELVKLEDPRFEQAFVTYSSDQQEARYILSPSLMERMLEIRGRFGSEVHFAFIGGQVYIALTTDGTHFEASLFQSGVSHEEIRGHLSLIQAVVGIVEDLRLNQRIWTKQ